MKCMSHSTKKRTNPKTAIPSRARSSSAIPRPAGPARPAPAAAAARSRVRAGGGQGGRPVWGRGRREEGGRGRGRGRGGGDGRGGQGLRAPVRARSPGSLSRARSRLPALRGRALWSGAAAAQHSLGLASPGAGGPGSDSSTPLPPHRLAAGLRAAQLHCPPPQLRVQMETSCPRPDSLARPAFWNRGARPLGAVRSLLPAHRAARALAASPARGRPWAACVHGRLRSGAHVDLAHWLGSPQLCTSPRRAEAPALQSLGGSCPAAGCCPSLWLCSTGAPQEKKKKKKDRHGVSGSLSSYSWRFCCPASWARIAAARSSSRPRSLSPRLPFTVASSLL